MLPGWSVASAMAQGVAGAADSARGAGVRVRDRLLLLQCRPFIPRGVVVLVGVDCR